MIANVGAERSIIGDIMLDAETVMPEAALYLTDRSFSDPVCSAIFGYCLKIYSDNGKIDPVTVAGYAGSGETADRYLQACMAMAVETPTISHYKKYIKIVKNCAQIRAAQEKTFAFQSTLVNEVDTEVLREQASDIARCFDDNEKESSVSAKDGFLQFYTNLEKKKEYIPTGFRWLDQKIFFDKGHYMVVGGRPSSGKTALTLQMALHIARQYRVVYFSLETSTESVYARLGACFTGTSFSGVKKRSVTDDELRRIFRYSDDFAALHLDVVQAAGWTTAQIRSKAIQLKADVIFIDYLTLIQSKERTQYEKATQISIDLHTMAQQLGIAVVALAQLNRSGNDLPDMTSLRESGQIEQDADIILLLHQPDPESSDRKIAVAKCKDGTQGAQTFHFFGDKQRFSEIDTEHRENRI